jgi:hypothetical protein
LSRLLPAETEPICATENFDGITQWGNSQDLHLFPFKEAQLTEPLHEGRLALNSNNRGVLTDPEIVKGRHNPATLLSKANHNVGAFIHPKA